ncbi:hypothetical protein LCGC14_2613320, partial [marine sediment metagenome]
MTVKSIDEKECTKCKKVQSFSEFYKQKGRKFGLTSHCKHCCDNRAREY